MAAGTDHREGVTGRLANESRLPAHGLLHIRGGGITTMTAGTRDPPYIMDVALEKLRRGIRQRCMAVETAVGSSGRKHKKRKHQEREKRLLHASHPITVKTRI
jgi:hypothetical protein